MKKRICILFLAFFVKNIAFSQTIKESFESDHMRSWEIYNTVDFFHPKNPSSWGTKTPKNYVGYQEPHNGKGYLGMVLSNNFEATLELVSFNLNDSLKKGQKYYLEFYLSLADKENDVSSKREMNLCFSKEKLTMYEKKMKGYMTYQVPCNCGVKVDMGISSVNKKDWTKISYIYTAKGGENYVTLGNIVNEVQKKLVHKEGVGYYGAYYYLDDFLFMPYQEYIDSINISNTELIKDTIKHPKVFSQEKLKTISFNSGDTILLQSSYSILNDITAYLKANTKTKILIEGHTDNVGKSEANQILSEKRAKAVVSYLIAQGVNKEQLTSKGFGDSNPKSDNKTEEGKNTNRRVEIKIVE